jgi:hypothetical protein
MGFFGRNTLGVLDAETDEVPGNFPKFPSCSARSLSATLSHLRGFALQPSFAGHLGIWA